MTTPAADPPPTLHDHLSTREQHWRITSFNVARSYNPSDLVATIQALHLDYLAIQEPPQTLHSPTSLHMYDRVPSHL